MSTEDKPKAPPALQDPEPKEYTKRIIRQKVWRRCNIENQHFMGVVVGREGTGKSHTALKIASGVDPTFDAERVFFDPKHLLETLQDDQYGAGTAVVIDEAGVGMGNRSWYEKDQILLNQALQTARDDNMAVLFTLPRESELDSQTRGRLHARIEMTKVYPRRGYADARWLNLKPSRDGSNEIYNYYTDLRVNGKKKKIERCRFKELDDESLLEHYEERKSVFKEALYQKAIDAQEDGEEGDDLGPKEVAEEVAKEGIGPFVSENGSTKNAYINKDLIRVEYGLSHSDASASKKLLEKVFTKAEIEKAL